MRSILVEKYNAIVHDIEHGISINKNELLFLLASGEEDGFVDEFRDRVEIKNEKDFIESVIDPTTDNFAAWIEIDGWVYIDIHMPHELPKAVKVNIQNIKSLGPANSLEYKFLVYKCEWV